LHARLTDRDDTRPLAILKSAVRLHPPRPTLPAGIVRHLLDRLDRPGRRTYVRLLSMFVDGIAPHRVELVEPRFAAVLPAAHALTRPQSQPGAPTALAAALALRPPQARALFAHDDSPIPNSNNETISR